jgi:hypothetical protein
LCAVLFPEGAGESRKIDDDHQICVLQEEKFGAQFGETAVAKDTDRYRMKVRRYSGRLVRLVKTVGRDPNCILFVTVEIRTR